jgi:hypothetical protein
MERVTWDEELDVFPAAHVWTDDDALARAVAAQKQDLERITEVIVVQLVIADAVEPHRCGWRDHEVERGSDRPSVAKR